MVPVLVQGAVVMEYFYHEEMNWHFSHRWAYEIMRDSGLPVLLAAVTCTNPAYAEWDRLVINVCGLSYGGHKILESVH